MSIKRRYKQTYTIRLFRIYVCSIIYTLSLCIWRITVCIIVSLAKLWHSHRWHPHGWRHLVVERKWLGLLHLTHRSSSQLLVSMSECTIVTVLARSYKVLKTKLTYLAFQNSCTFMSCSCCEMSLHGATFYKHPKGVAGKSFNPNGYTYIIVFTKFSISMGKWAVVT